jgi:RNA polymerase sigma-70 factor (ECF subfamily)
LTGSQIVDQAQPHAPAHDASTDVALLTDRIRAGNEAAFREFHERYFDRLYQFLLMIARGQEDEAREALQETLLRVVRHVRRFDTEDAFWSWLTVVARSAARDGWRKRQRYFGLLQRFALHSEESVATTDPSGGNPLGPMLEESLAELDAPDRQMVLGKYLDGETVKELAAETGLTEKAVESRLLRLRRHVRESMLKKIREV